MVPSCAKLLVQGKTNHLTCFRVAWISQLIFASEFRDISKEQKLIQIAQARVWKGLVRRMMMPNQGGESGRKEQPEEKQVEIDALNFSEDRWLQLNDNCLLQVNKKELCEEAE